MFKQTVIVGAMLFVIHASHTLAADATDVADKAANGTVVKLAADLSNSDIRWDGQTFGLVAEVNGKSAKQLLKLGKSANAVLVKLMGNAEQFAAAHVLLTQLNAPIRFGTASEWNGLRVKLLANGNVEIDPKQRRKLKKYWVKQLGLK